MADARGMDDRAYDGTWGEPEGKWWQIILVSLLIVSPALVMFAVEMQS
jgi:hypothetical protein